MCTGLADAVDQGRGDDPLRVAGDADPARCIRSGASGVELAGGERLAADAVVCNADLPVAYRTLLGRRRRATRRPPRALLAVVPAVGRRRPRRDRRPARPTTTSTSAAQWDESFRALIHDGAADGRPVDPRHAALARRPVAGPARLLDAVRPRAGAQPRRARRLDAASRRCRRPPAPPGRRRRLPDRRRHRGGLRPARLGGDGHGARHAVRPRPHVPPDRAVPAAQRRPAGAGARVRRLVDGARRRRADGAGVRQARRRARPARWTP